MKKLIIVSLIFFSINLYGQSSHPNENNKRKILRITMVSLGAEYESFLTENTSLLTGFGFLPKIENSKWVKNAFSFEVEYRRYSKKQITRNSLFTFFQGARFLYSPDYTFYSSETSSNSKYATFNFGYDVGYQFRYKFIHLLFSIYLPVSYDANNEFVHFAPMPQINIGFNVFEKR